MRLAVNLLRSGALRQVGLVAMFTSNMLKSKENISFDRGGSRASPVVLSSALLSLLLFLAIPSAHAQLVLGASLDDRVEESTEEQVEESVAEQVQDQIQDQIEERVLVLGAEAIEDTVQDQVEDGVQDAIEEELSVTSFPHCACGDSI